MFWWKKLELCYTTPKGWFFYYFQINYYSFQTGPRRVGKTTLLKNIVKQSGKSHMFLNGEDLSTTELFGRRTAENYRSILSDVDLLVIDEAQHIPEIGYIAKAN